MAPTKDKLVHRATLSNSMDRNNEPSLASKDGKKIPAPPPPTRHRGVLEIAPPIPLYDFGNQFEEPTLQSIVNESRDAQPLFNVSSVCTDNQQVIASDNQMVHITIRFYGKDGWSDQNGSQEHHLKEIKALMPKTWTPRMYLGAVNVSIEQSHSIIIETISFRGKRYVSINNVHWLFSELNLNDPSLVASKLISNAAYFNVVGGELRNSL